MSKSNYIESSFAAAPKQLRLKINEILIAIGIFCKDLGL